MPIQQPELPSNGQSFEQLLAVARGGSREAVGELIQSCRAYLMLIANQELDPTVRRKVGASDIVQETLLSAQAEIGEFRGRTRDDLLSWLRAILKNDVFESRREFRDTEKRQIDREVPLDRNEGGNASIRVEDPANTPGTAAVVNEESRALAAATARLPEDYQQVVRLRNWEQLPFEEIGKRMNRSADAARKLWSRAILQLQRELGL